MSGVSRKRRELKRSHLLSKEANVLMHSSEDYLAESEASMFYGKNIGLWSAKDNNSYVYCFKSDKIYGPFDNFGDAAVFAAKAFGVMQLRSKLFTEDFGL